MKKLLFICISALAIAASFSGPTFAQQASANKEYMASMEKMDADMKKGMDPDPTKAWAKMWSPNTRVRSRCPRRSSRKPRTR